MAGRNSTKGGLRRPGDGAPGRARRPCRTRTGRPSPGGTAEGARAEEAGPPGRGVRETIIRSVAIVTLGYSLVYLTWRLTATLNPDALWFSLPLWAAEAYGLLTLGMLVFTTWHPRHRPPRPAAPGHDVDVFITTYNEPIEVIRKTAVAAREIRYPHRTWILDDGCRDEVRELSQRLGIGYIPREESEHAKAGNLNTALGLTSGDFILQLDADHVPLPHILDRLLGYFDDPRVGFVQSPQDFYNLDSFTHVVDDNGRRVWEEQRLFFNVIQPGKDRWNAAFFCGSCGIVRRAALEETGGFSTETITEDMETSLLLHARGWRSVYVEESLAYGLSPGSASAYAVQRLRWGQGSMQILRKFNPLTLPGLTLAQRVCYFSSVTCYFDGVQKLVFLAAPFVYFLTGALPIDTLDFAFLVRFFPYLFLTILTFELLARGHGYLWLSERYNMVRWPIYLRALAGYFRSEPLPFEVTPKGAGKVPLKVVAPQLAILVLSPLVLVWATLAHGAGWIDYGAPGWRSAAFLLNGLWMAWNAWFALEVVRMARRLRQEDDYRFKEELPVLFHVADRVGLEARPGIGLTQEVSSSMVQFLSATPAHPRERVRLRLPLTTGARTVTGRVLARREVERAGVTLSSHLCRVEDLDLETQVAIELHCVHHAVPGRQQRYSRRPDLFEDGRRFFQERRRERRPVVRLPAQVQVPGDGNGRRRWTPAVLEELGPRGAQLILTEDVREGTELRFHVPGIDLEASGVVAWCRPLETPLSRRFIVGIDRAPGEPRSGRERSP